MVPFLKRVANLKNSLEHHDSFSCTGIPLIDISSFNIVRNAPIWIEISESDLGIPAAAMRVLDWDMKVWRFPKDIWDKLEPKTYHFRTVDDTGNEINHFTYVHAQAI